jgi:hypothetical protein
MDKKALIELAKSFGRFIWFGLLGLVSTFLVNLVASGDLKDINVVIGGLEVNLAFVVLAGITGLIKLIDRYRHVNENIDSKGIAPKFLQG